MTKFSPFLDDMLLLKDGRIFAYKCNNKVQTSTKTKLQRPGENQGFYIMFHLYNASPI